MGRPGAPLDPNCCGDYISSHLLSRLTQIYSHCRVEVDLSRTSEDGGKQRGSEGPSEGHREEPMEEMSGNARKM